mgnify:CR=1 FL=1
MNKAKDYIQLHLNILLFSLTSVFSKAASVQLNRGGIKNPLLYVFLFLMVANCGIYAIAWQKVIKKFSLSTAYANRSVYLIWSQIWAVIIFHENLTVKNIIGLLILMLICTMFSAVSQILLKQSANEEHASALREYLNWRVIVAYLIFGSVLLLNTYAYTQVDLKYGPVLDTFTYVFVLLLSFGVLKEKVSKGKLIGNLIIILGVLVYTLP